MISFDAVTHLRNALSDPAWEALISSVAETKAFAEELARKKVENTFFIIMSDPEAIDCLVKEAYWERERAMSVVTTWRTVAGILGYNGPICWRVKPGFTLKKHAPLAGPCYEDFRYLQDWALKNDEPTKNSIVFCVPKLVPGSTSKTVSEQEKLRERFRKDNNLPKNHMVNFGQASVLSGVLLSRKAKSGDRELPNVYTRTDTLATDGHRLNVGHFVEDGLYCDDWWDDSGCSHLGFVPLGVEELSLAA